MSPSMADSTYTSDNPCFESHDRLRILAVFDSRNLIRSTLGGTDIVGFIDRSRSFFLVECHVAFFSLGLGVQNRRNMQTTNAFF